MKRSIDLIVAFLLVIILAPIMLVIAVVIFIESGRPILYRRRCAGLNGRPFDILRFRTMSDSPMHQTPDERLTPVGRFLRNYSLDELPLLLNVLRGDMNIVGPRPTETATVDLADAQWQRILSVRPGIVGYAILSLARDFNASDERRKKQLETAYVIRRSPRFDLHIMGKAAVSWLASGGNIKARGKPSADRQDRERL